MAKAKTLTARGIEAIQADPVARREIPDGGVPGLYLIVQPTGSKSWAARYRLGDRPRKVTLGRYPEMTLASARNKARAALEAVARGEDPAAAAQEAKAAAKAAAQADPDKDLVKGVVAEFVKRHCATKRDGDETARLLRKNLLPTLGEKRLDAIGRRDVIELLDGIVDRGAPYTANRTFAAFRTCCNWAIRRGVIEVSPCAGVKAPAPETRRDRVLSDAELKWFWRATGEAGPPFGPLFRLLLLTAARREEVAAMTAAEIDRDAATWVIPAARSKNGKPHAVPLSGAALAALDEQPRILGPAGLIFTTTGRTPVSGFGRAKARLDAAMAQIAQAEGATFEPWRLHDLRRTVASNMARLGVSMPVVEKLLNHISGSFGGIQGVYQRYSYADEMRRAVETWASFLADLTGEAVPNVVYLPGARAAVQQ